MSFVQKDKPRKQPKQPKQFRPSAIHPPLNAKGEEFLKTVTPFMAKFNGVDEWLEVLHIDKYVFIVRHECGSVVSFIYKSSLHSMELDTDISLRLLAHLSKEATK